MKFRHFQADDAVAARLQFRSTSRRRRFRSVLVNRNLTKPLSYCDHRDPYDRNPLKLKTNTALKRNGSRVAIAKGIKRDDRIAKNRQIIIR